MVWYEEDVLYVLVSDMGIGIFLVKLVIIFG